jgi:cell division septum initiation protein DivIVA
MKETGSLLRDTLIQEARMNELIAEAEADAEKIITAAEKEAEAVLERARASCASHREKAFNDLNNETADLNTRYESKREDAIKSMNEKFDAVCPALARDIAERILNNGT